MHSIIDYFPLLDDRQQQQIALLQEVYTYWNEKINVISRKDMNQFYTHHVLHSLGIAKIQGFNPGAEILDVGTGGGFPGVPLAILFPQTQFVLVDSIGKKIFVVEQVVKALQLKNVKAMHTRVENISQKFDFIVSRAVTQMPKFVSWISGKIKQKNKHTLSNGILYLKGGDLHQELQSFTDAQIFNLSDVFQDTFFETKKVVHLPIK